MAYEHKFISFMTTDDFKKQEMYRIGSITLMRRSEGDQYFESYEPESLTVDEFTERLEKLGELKKVEQYVSTFTGLPVLRGAVTKDDDKDYFFCVALDYNGNVVKDMAELVVQCVKLSGTS